MKCTELITTILNEHLRDPRNKIFIPWEGLLQSAREELGKEIDPTILKTVFHRVINRESDEDDEILYDAALSIVGTAATTILNGNDPDLGYSVSILETDDGFLAEIRP